jgi:hypothetical protein
LASTTATRLAGPSATKASARSGVSAIPTGWMLSAGTPGTANSIVRFTACVAASITDTVPPTSEETHTSAPSAVNRATRGRLPTSTLATTSLVAVSMKCAMLVVSDVLTSMPPSGLTPIPSGSTPTGISVTIRPDFTSSTETMLSFSLAT